MPPLSSAGRRSKLPSSPTSASRKRACSASSASSSGRRSRPSSSRRLSRCANIRFSPTLIELHSAPAWNITPRRRRRRRRTRSSASFRSSPSSRMRPAAGVCSPIMWRSSVLLPQPLPPMIARISPRRTAKSRPCWMTRPPCAIVRPSTRMMSASVAITTPASGRRWSSPRRPRRSRRWPAPPRRSPPGRRPRRCAARSGPGGSPPARPGRRRACP